MYRVFINVQLLFAAYWFKVSTSPRTGNLSSASIALHRAQAGDDRRVADLVLLLVDASHGAFPNFRLTVSGNYNVCSCFMCVSYIVQSNWALQKLSLVSLLYLSMFDLRYVIVRSMGSLNSFFSNFLEVPCWGYPTVGFLQSAPRVRLPVHLAFRLDLSSKLTCLYAEPGSSCHGTLKGPAHVHHTTGFMKRDLWREYLRRYNDQINFHFKCYQS